MFENMGEIIYERNSKILLNHDGTNMTKSKSKIGLFFAKQVFAWQKKSMQNRWIGDIHRVKWHYSSHPKCIWKELIFEGCIDCKWDRSWKHISFNVIWKYLNENFMIFWDRKLFVVDIKFLMKNQISCSKRPWKYPTFH